MRPGRESVSTSAILAFAAAGATVWALRAGPTLPAMILLVATAGTVVWLIMHPLHLRPDDDLPLIIVPVLVALGIGRAPVALAGGILGLATAATLRPEAWGRAPALEEAAAVVAAALIRLLDPLPDLPLGLGSLVLVGGAYVAVRTLLVATRIAREERMSWSRAAVVEGSVTAAALAVPLGMALVSVVIERLWLSQASRLALSALPLLAGAVVLQIFQPHSVRGREDRRSLAATAVLADAMDVKDPLTGMHSQAVAQLSRQIARAAGVSEPLAHDAYVTGLLHDIGKVAVPDAILQKPAELTEAEWRVMQSHVLDSAAMVESITGLARIAPLVRGSHEWYDGSGYPDGLRGRAIPLAARIVAIADAYHALISDRVYRERRGPEAALAELERCSGTQFDPELVRALRTVVGGVLEQPPERADRPVPTWRSLLRQRSFALLWGGELVSFLGDEVFFIAITLWVYTLTGSAAALGAALAAIIAGQAVFSSIAGVVADRVDRRLIVAVSDAGRALVVAALPVVLPRSLPAALVLLGLLNVGSVFFRAAVNALLPSIASRDELQTANALFQTTERIAEVAGGVLGAAAVLTLGYAGVMFADAASFLVSAACVLLMPLAWGAGLGLRRGVSFPTDLAAGVRYLWQIPFQRYFALLIVPGYFTLAFDVLKAPMVVNTAHLSTVAYGVVNSALGAGRLVTAIALAGLTSRLASPGLAVAAYVLAGVGIAVFAAAPWYLGLVAGAFVYAVGNMLSTIVNTTLVQQATPQALLGRVLGNRQVLVQSTRFAGVLMLGRLADVTSPPVALWVMAGVTVVGVLGVWIITGRSVALPASPLAVPEGARAVAEAEPR